MNKGKKAVPIIVNKVRNYFYKELLCTWNHVHSCYKDFSTVFRYEPVQLKSKIESTYGFRLWTTSRRIKTYVKCIIASSVLLRAVYYCKQCIIASSVLLQAVYYCEHFLWASQEKLPNAHHPGLEVEKTKLNEEEESTLPTIQQQHYYSWDILVKFRYNLFFSAVLRPRMSLNLFLFLTVNIFSFKMLFRYWIFAHNIAVGHILEKSRFDFCTFHTVAVKITKNYIFSSLEQCL